MSRAIGQNVPQQPNSLPELHRLEHLGIPLDHTSFPVSITLDDDIKDDNATPGRFEN